MRCPNCGTENAPDSRFCGGCGARMQTSGLVAPTQKISDDAPYPATPAAYPASIPPANNVASGPASLPPTYPPQNVGPASVPPQNYTPPPSIPPANHYVGPPSIAPANQGPPSVASSRSAAPAPKATGPAAAVRTPTAGTPAISRRAPYSDASLSPSLAVPKRRWGLIIFVLILDLALAGAGVYLLTEGLA